MRSSLIVSPEVVTDIEKEIDRIDSLLPPLKVFILPGGSRAAAICNVCRTICRRAERCIIRLTEGGGNVDENVLAYVNRLSDYFFLLARKLNQDNKIEDIIWKE
jgi:cob(I)alamin adenosyltransferase